MSVEVREAISDAIFNTILDETDDTIPCCNNCKYNRPYFIKRCIDCDGESRHAWEETN